MSKFKFKLGLKAKCKITGFTGIIIGRAEHLTGCNTYGIKPPVDDSGKLQEAAWFDEGIVEVIGERIKKEDAQSDDPGGPLSEHPSI